VELKIMIDCDRLMKGKTGRKLCRERRQEGRRKEEG